MSFPTFPQHGELPATPLPPREAQRGPAGFEKLPAHVLGRRRHRAEHAEASGLTPGARSCARSGQAPCVEHSTSREPALYVPQSPSLPATPRPRKTPPVCREGEGGVPGWRGLCPHTGPQRGRRMGWGLKAAVGLAPGLWGAWAKSERARPASRTVGGSHRE